MRRPSPETVLIMLADRFGAGRVALAGLLNLPVDERPLARVQAGSPG